jgi:hypothetical protein
LPGSSVIRRRKEKPVTISSCELYEALHAKASKKPSYITSELGAVTSRNSYVAAHADISPMQYSSGQRDKNLSNKRGNGNLHQILFFMAVSLANDPANRGKPVNQYFYDYYRKKISEG